MAATYYSGDTAPFIVTCRLGAAPYVIANSDTVEAAFIDEQNGVAITAALPQSSSTAGASWGLGEVAVVFTAEEGSKLAPFAGQRALLEIQVTKPTGKQTFQAEYLIKRGYIA